MLLKAIVDISVMVYGRIKKNHECTHFDAISINYRWEKCVYRNMVGYIRYRKVEYTIPIFDSQVWYCTVFHNVHLYGFQLISAACDAPKSDFIGYEFPGMHSLANRALHMTRAPHVTSVVFYFLQASLLIVGTDIHDVLVPQPQEEAIANVNVVIVGNDAAKNVPEPTRKGGFTPSWLWNVFSDDTDTQHDREM